MTIKKNAYVVLDTETSGFSKLVFDLGWITRDKKGNVIDSSGFDKAVKKPKYLWLKQNGPKYNWHNPPWAVNVKGTPEAWHWEPTSTVLKNVRK